MQMTMEIFNAAKESARKAFFETTPSSENLCGFAWLIIQNDRKLLNWFKKNKIGTKHWPKGWSISVYDLVGDIPSDAHFWQSYDRKVAAVNAAIVTLRMQGITATLFNNHRLD